MIALLACSACASTQKQVETRRTVVVVPSKQAQDREMIAALQGAPPDVQAAAAQPGATVYVHDETVSYVYQPSGYSYSWGYPGPYYAGGYYYPPHYRVPTPSSVVIVRDLPPGARRYDKWHYDRAAARCGMRPTKFAQDRCYREVAR
jgi:hypothetical protein